MVPTCIERRYQFDLGWSEKTLLGRGTYSGSGAWLEFKQSEKTVESFLGSENSKSITVEMAIFKAGMFL